MSDSLSRLTQSQRRPLGPRTPTTVHRSDPVHIAHVACWRGAAGGAGRSDPGVRRATVRRATARRATRWVLLETKRVKTFWKNESAETRKGSQQRRARSCSCPVWRHRSVAEPCRWLALAWALPFAPTAPYVAPCRKRFGVQRCRSLRPSKRLGTAQLAEEDVGHNEVRLIGAAIEHVRQADLLHARDLLFERSAATSRLDHHFVVAHRVTAQVGVETDLRTVR